MPGRSIHRRLIWRGCKLTQKPPPLAGGGGPKGRREGGRRLPLPHRLRAEPPRKRRGLRNCEVLHVIFRFLSFPVSLRRSAVGPAGGAGRVGGGDRAAGLRVRRVAAGRAACTVCGGTGLYTARRRAGGSGRGGHRGIAFVPRHAAARHSEGPRQRGPVGLPAAGSAHHAVSAAHPRSASGGRRVPHGPELLRRYADAPRVHQIYRAER